MNFLENTSFLLAEHNVYMENSTDILSKILPNTPFNSICLISSHGMILNDDGTYIDVSNHEYFKSALNGDASIYSPISYNSNLPMIPMSSPIYDDNGDVYMVLVGFYSVDTLFSYIISTCNKNIDISLVNSSGDLL